MVYDYTILCFNSSRIVNCKLLLNNLHGPTTSESFRNKEIRSFIGKSHQPKIIGENVYLFFLLRIFRIQSKGFYISLRIETGESLFPDGLGVRVQIISIVKR